MTIKFDAWVDPWIPVEKIDGTYTQIGICEALRDAAQIRAVRAPTPTESFGIQRLLITVLTDIYRPDHLSDLDNLYLSGCLDGEKLETYHQTCLEEGCSFDLFDPERPFLQYVFGEKEKADKKPIANLFDQIPTGNNVPHFNHSAEDMHAITPARCLQGLAAIPFFEKHKRGKKVTSGINGAPPVYFLYHGNTLFETLILSMVSKGQYHENDYGTVIWRDKNCFGHDGMVTPGFLHGLYSAPLKILLVPSEDGFVREIIMEEGISYKEARWTDPHVAYASGKKQELVSLKAKNGRMVWRDLPVFTKPDALKILFGWSTRDLDNLAFSGLVAYVKYCELKGTLFMAVSQFTEDIKLSNILLANEHKMRCYANAVSVSDNLAKECGDALKRSLRQLRGNGSSSEANPFANVLPNAFSEMFLSEIKTVFDKELVDLLVGSDTDTPDWEDRINRFLAEKFRSTVFLSLNAALDTIGDENADMMILKHKLHENSLKKMYILLKKGGYINNDGRNSGKQNKR
jgi:hypothetical protein